MALASIQKIRNVFPIPNADKIEGVEVLGWKCVVKKGEFKINDLCIYIEIDSLLPRSEYFEFLFKPEDKSEKYRLKTIRLRGQISQGLVLKIDGLLYFDFMTWREECKYSDLEIPEIIAGQDVTDFLDIEKYEKFIPANMQGLTKGNFPNFLQKTDEVRIQSQPDLLEKLAGKEFYITTKLDGTSATYYMFEGKFGVCSRNLELKDGNNIYWNMARKYNLEKIIPDGICIQGEICGPGIQGNKLKLNEPDLYIFNVRNIQGWDTKGNNIGMILNSKELKFVPCEMSGDYFDFSLEYLLELAKGEYPNGGKKEGIVVRSYDETISFKVLNNDFLLENGE